MRPHVRLLAVAAVLGLVAAACGGGAETTTTTAAATTTTTAAGTTTTAAGTTTSAGPAVTPISACQVTDTGGIDDKSFNQTAWKGVLDAIDDGFAKPQPDSGYLESQVETDYAPNIQQYLDKGCDLIITVGYLLGDATKAAAEANPNQKFEIIDYTYDPPISNVVGTAFNTQEAAFLAGYLAAGVSKTGVVATYGGIQLPGAVTFFMDGFVWGVQYYNQKNGTDVKALGWDPTTQKGVFTGDFESLDKGRATTQSFIDEGADVILPVAGPVGEGSAALAQEKGNVWVIGVDADWFQTLPQYKDVVLTSVLKGLDVAVYDVIKATAEGNFQGGNQTFTLAENGVGLGPINDAVPADLVSQVEQVKQGVADGSIKVGS